MSKEPTPMSDQDFKRAVEALNVFGWNPTGAISKAVTDGVKAEVKRRGLKLSDVKKGLITKS